jgi:hypothetical protein
VTSPRPATVRFYFDADVLGLAKLLARERADFTYPGDPGGQIKKRVRPPCPITTPQARDEDWIPIVAAQRWLIISRDRHIQEKPAELNAVRIHNAKLVTLAGKEAGSTWAQLEVLMSQWREIEALADEPGPFIYVATRRGGLRPIGLS